MNRERIQQIRQAVDHNPRGADGYVYELARAAEELLGRIETAQAEVERLRGIVEVNDRRLAAVWDEARAEVEMLRGVGCGELREGAEVPDGPCGACLKCARRERDEARAEAAQLRKVLEAAGDRLRACGYELTEHSYQEMASVIFDLPASATIEQLRAEFPEVMP